MTRHVPKSLIAQGKTIITAHSGCEGTGPNSREHILAAIESGAEMIEVDLRMAPDGTLYLSHDVLEGIDRCPLLADLFQLIASEDSMGINLDAKTNGLIPPAMELARSFGIADRIIFTGSCNSDRRQAVSFGADVWHSMWYGDSIPAGIERILEDGSPCLNVFYPMITTAYDKALRAHGRGFSAWTVNDEESLRRYLEMGIANITTRKPLLAMKLRKEIQGI